MVSRYPCNQQRLLLAGLLLLVVLCFSAACAQQQISSTDERPPTPTAVLAEPAYSPSDGVVAITDAQPNTPPEGDTRDPWLGEEAWITGVQAGQQYIAEHPEPQNVQILKGMNTSEIWVYMQQHISGALGVSCQYCHDIGNFAADPYTPKISARLMLVMVNDLNRDFVTDLPQWRGNYVQCATCHNTEPINLPAVSPENAFVVFNPPYDTTQNYMVNWIIDTPAIHPDGDYVHRHTATGTMLAMSNHMANNWNRYVLPRPELQELDEEALPRDNRQYYLAVDETYYNVPACYTCHRGYTVPSAAISKEYLDSLADDGYTVLPPMLRGMEQEANTQQ